MKLREYLEDVNIFELMDGINPLPFETTTQFSNLDLRLKVLHGNRPLFSSFEKLEPEIVANLLVLDFSEKWEKLIGVLALSNNINPRREVTETITSGETRTNTSSTLGKVSGFNSDELLINDGNEVEGLDVSDGERIRTLTDAQINLEQSFKMLNIVDRNSILQTVMADVSGYLTLSIYN